MVLGTNVRCSSGLTPSGCCILCSVSLFKAQTVATRSVPVMSSALSIQLLCCHFSHTARVPCEQRWLQYFTLLASPEWRWNTLTCETQFYNSMSSRHSMIPLNHHGCTFCVSIMFRYINMHLGALRDNHLFSFPWPSGSHCRRGSRLSCSSLGLLQLLQWMTSWVLHICKIHSELTQQRKLKNPGKSIQLINGESQLKLQFLS